jgi:hypothetical protein
MAQERAQQRQPATAPAPLRQRARIVADRFGQWIRRQRCNLQRGRFRHKRAAHLGVPVVAPALARLQPANDAVLRNLVEGYAPLARPATHGAVALEGPVVAHLLVRPQRGDAVRLVNLLQHCDGVARA